MKINQINVEETLGELASRKHEHEGQELKTRLKLALCSRPYFGRLKQQNGDLSGEYLDSDVRNLISNNQLDPTVR